MEIKGPATHSYPVSPQRPHRGRGWTWWLVPRPFDLTSSLLYIGVLAPYLYSFISRAVYNLPLTWWQAALMIAATFSLLTIDRLEYFFYGDVTPRRAAFFLILTRLFFIEILSWIDKFTYTPFLYLSLLFLACLSFGELIASAMAVLTLIMYIIKHLFYSPRWLSSGIELHYFVLFIIANALVITIAHIVLKEKTNRRRAEELFAELQVSHRQLKEYTGQMAELAATKERNRLVRDIHDALGHYLTVINVQLEKALALREKKPQEAEQAVTNAKRLASEALQDVRRSVSALRTSEELPEFAPSLRTLVERMQNESCRVELNMQGNEESYSKQGLLALYRVAQEGLTNIQKHAQASRVWVDLQFGEHEARLILRDNGCGFNLTRWQQTEPGRDGGYGLQGGQERLALLGGNLLVESMPGQGTTLQVTLPKIDNN